MMEEKAISRKSLAWRLATKYGGMNPNWYYEDDPLTICSFRGWMLFAMFKIVMFGAALVLVVHLMGLLAVFAWMAWMVLNLELIAPSAEALALLQVGGMFLIVGGGAAAVLWTFMRVSTFFEERNKDTEPVKKEPSAFVLAYRSWREKACYKISFKD